MNERLDVAMNRYTLANANHAADLNWHYLTKCERARTTIDVGAVTKDDLAN